MNEPTDEPTLEASFHKVIESMKTFAHRDPVRAVAIAFGAGLLINLLPTRLVATSTAAVGATLLRPVLLSLGVIKAAELCTAKTTLNTTYP